MTGPLRWLVTGFAALLVAWVVVPGGLPLYDGIGNPDEPYRYVLPPPDAKTTKAPTTARATVDVVDGANRAQFANSAEQGPQISVYVAPGGLGVPPGAKELTLRATPMAPAAPLPTDGTVVTNVYRVEVVADSGGAVQVTGTGAQGASIQMRAPSARQPGPVFERRTATGWERLKTLRAGTDIYQTSPVTAFGDFALVQLSSESGSSGGGGVNVGLLAGGIGLLVLGAVVVAIRARRTGRTESG